MCGKRITHQQVKLYMKDRQSKKYTQAACAAKNGMSERTAREIDHNRHCSQKPYTPRQYKTRKSSIDEIWESDLKPLLLSNIDLQPMTLFIHMQRTYLDDNGLPLYDQSCLRSLQRKVSDYKALHGPSKEVMFPQKHYPGKQGLSDFTSMNDLSITVGGQALRHMLYVFRLVYSKYSYAKVIYSGESFQALSEGLQEALYAIGGSPLEHRTDSLSAAYKNDKDCTAEDLTENYQQLCEYYCMQPTRNNKGVSHENGSVESSHGHLKNRIDQELILRGNREFDSIESYEQWIHGIVQSHNQRNSKNFKTEKQHLQALPARRAADYEVKSVKVSKQSTIAIKNITYSVPSRLVGHTVTLHITQKSIDGYLGANLVFTFSRRYTNATASRYVIDYRHLIHAMIKKPRAFRCCLYKEELLPSQAFKQIWQHLEQTERSDIACKIILRLLKLACDYDCEESLAEHCLELITQGGHLPIETIEKQYNHRNPPLPTDLWQQHSLSSYDHFITNTQTTGEHYAH
jgi:hypothetical protein